MPLIYYYQAKLCGELEGELIYVTLPYATSEALYADLRDNLDELGERITDFQRHCEYFIRGCYLGDVEEGGIEPAWDDEKVNRDFNKKLLGEWMETLIETGEVETLLFTGNIVKKPFLAEYDRDLRNSLV